VNKNLSGYNLQKSTRGNQRREFTEGNSQMTVYFVFYQLIQARQIAGLVARAGAIH